MKNLYIISIIMVCLLTVGKVYAQSDSAKIYFKKGQDERSAGRYMIASQDFNAAINFDPKYTDAYLQDAYVNMTMRRTDEAKADFQKVYDMDSHNEEAVKNLTELYYDYHQYQQAIAFAGKCKTCDNPERIIAMSEYQLENYEDAITYLTDVIKKDPGDAEAVYAIGRSYLEIEEYVKAVPYYQDAIRLEPTKNEWIYELGLLYYSNDDYKDAVVMFDHAAAAGYNQSSDFNENLGFACVYSGSFERGEKILLGLVVKRPNNKELLRGLADAYYTHKLYDKSLEFCQKLLVLDAKDGQALYQAGLCFQKKGDIQKGQQLCDEAIQIDPSLANLRQKQMTTGL